MKNKIIISLMMILLIGSVIGITISLTNVEITPKTDIPPDANIIEFQCGGKTMTVNSYESKSDLDDNDIRSLIQRTCSETATDIKLGSDYWKVNKYGLESFNETLLKEDECMKDGNIFDTKDGSCSLAPTEEELCIADGKVWVNGECIEPKEPPVEEGI